jgi:hypothetical protein
MTSPGWLLSIALLVTSAGCAGTPAAKPSSSVVPAAQPEPGGNPEADVERITWIAREVTFHLAEMRRQQQHVTWLACLNDKLNQAHAMRRAAVERLRGLQEARARGDDAEMLRERKRITLQRERADGLLQESRQCVGERVGA